MHLCVQIYYQGIVQQLRWSRANLTSNNPNLYLIDTLISKRMNVFNTNECNVTIDWEDISYWYRRINFTNGNFISAIIFWWNKSTLSSSSSFCVTLEKKNDTRQALKDLMERTYIKFVQKTQRLENLMSSIFTNSYFDWNLYTAFPKGYFWFWFETVMHKICMNIGQGLIFQNIT